jgi:hypothetical protein
VLIIHCPIERERNFGPTGVWSFDEIVIRWHIGIIEGELADAFGLRVDVVMEM